MVEFRASNPKVQLKQEDYGNIESKLAFAYARLPKPRPGSIPKVHQMGLSQGALWCAAKDEFTYQFCLSQVPAFDTPNKYLPNPLLPPKPKPAKLKKGQKPPKKIFPTAADDPVLIRQWEVPANQLVYTYQVFGPDNKPYRYLKGRFPKDFWSEPEDFIEMLRAFHPELDEDIEDKRTGQNKKYHLRVSTGMEDKNDIVGGYFTLSLEIEEELLPVLAAMNGKLQILSTTIKLIGGGIDKAIAELNNVDVNAGVDPEANDIHEPEDEVNVGGEGENIAEDVNVEDDELNRQIFNIDNIQDDIEADYNEQVEDTMEQDEPDPTQSSNDN